jgi:hypothetical protein
MPEKIVTTRMGERGKEKDRRKEGLMRLKRIRR